MNWKDAKNNPPPKAGYGKWSEKDYFCCCMYSYEIGRMKDGKWVDMNNKPIDVILWMEIPKISKEHEELFET